MAPLVEPSSSLESRLDWYLKAKFGLFIHWGAYSVGGVEASWPIMTPDMARMAADPTTQEWWRRTDPCQEGLATRKPGEWWAEMEEVFFCA